MFYSLLAYLGLGSALKEQDSERDQASEEAKAVNRSRQAGPLRKVLLAVASLRLTVVLFALSIVLVFCGTLAQKDTGLLTVVNGYFRCWGSWIPFQVFFPNDPKGAIVSGGFPFPGGLLLGTLLLVNVLAAHAIRFRYTMKRAGIILIHAGIIVLMGGEVVTKLFAVENRMSIPEGLSSDYVERYEKVELAVVDSSAADKDHQVVIPQHLLRRGGRIHDDRLPFDVVVLKYMVNSALEKTAPGAADNPATASAGKFSRAVELPEVSGTKSRIDVASVYVKLLPKGSEEPLGTYLFSIHLTDQRVVVGDKAYEVSLRFLREYRPYKLQLLEFNHDRYIGTSTAKNYSSRVRLTDPSRKVDREVVISMNNPLRYQGETIFQADVLPGDTGTVLQVVQNPGALLPYVSCFLVGVGMILHFGVYLMGFLRRRGA